MNTPYLHELDPEHDDARRRKLFSLVNHIEPNTRVLVECVNIGKDGRGNPYVLSRQNLGDYVQQLVEAGSHLTISTTDHPNGLDDEGFAVDHGTETPHSLLEKRLDRIVRQMGNGNYTHVFLSTETSRLIWGSYPT